MRKLHISGKKSINPVLQSLLEQSLKNVITEEEELNLISEIRDGNSFAIDQLMISYEHLIFRGLIQNDIQPPFEDIINHARLALRRSLEIEMTGDTKKFFHRFSAWTVQQAILTQLQSR